MFIVHHVTILSVTKKVNGTWIIRVKELIGDEKEFSIYTKDFRYNEDCTLFYWK